MNAAFTDSPISPRIANLLLGAIREVTLEKPNLSEANSSFFVGIDDGSDAFQTRVGCHWWYSARFERLARALATAICRQLRDVAVVSHAEVFAAVEIALEDNRLNSLLVQHLFERPNTGCLFEIYSVHSANVVADTIWKRILKSLWSEIDSWLFVYPLQGVQANTTFFSTVGASVVATADVATYASFCDKFHGLRTLSLQTGQVGKDKRICEQQITTWLFLQSKGTAAVTFSDSSRNASMLLGLLISAYRINTCANAFVHSNGSAVDTAMQFSGGRAAYSVRGQDCGPLMHATVGTCKLDDSLIVACDEWLQKMKSAAPDLGQRAFAAARWVNQAVVSSGTTRFLFLFFAIDALFGERHYVLEAIRKGVVGSAGNEWDTRCERLFKIRSELVHGGAPSVSEWIGYERYREHFQSEPEDDMELLAATCLMNYWGK